MIRLVMSGAGLLILSGTLWAAPYEQNLLVNPGAETGNMSGWTILQNGGSGWSATFDGNVHSGNHSFSTSYAWDTRTQVVDLVAAGFTPAELDAVPNIVVSEWVGTRWDSGNSYFMSAVLQDAAHKPIATWNVGTQASPISNPAGAPWGQNSHTFSQYGSGVRYVAFSDGGISSKFYAGGYGAHFDDASVAVSIVPEPATLSLLAFGSLGVLNMYRKRKTC